MTAVIEIGLVMYRNAQQSAVLGLTDMFDIANDLSVNQAKFLVTRWSLAPGGVLTRGGEKTESGPAVLVVPPGRGTTVDRAEAALYAKDLRKHHTGGTVLASVCAGAFILAQTGLLDGRRATTHWMYEGEFRARFPEVDLDIAALLIDDVDIVMAGGMMAWTDLGLRLIERYSGPSAMLGTARMLLIDPPGREQRFYSSFVPPLDHGDSAILAAQHLMHASYSDGVSVRALAHEAGLGERTFLRRFLRATGKTSAEYLQHFRMNKARELLQTGTDSISEIAWRSGYSDAGAFRKVFLQIVGLSPSDYRIRFRSMNAKTLPRGNDQAPL